MTAYVVLRRNEAGYWSKVGEGTARSARVAVQQAVDAELEQGEYVAVPARSWRPVSVTVQTETKIRIG